MRPETAALRLLSVTRAKAKMYEYEVPPEEHIALPQRPAKVGAVALNTRELSEEDARAEIAATEAETGLPTDDPVRFGAGKLVDAVLARL